MRPTERLSLANVTTAQFGVRQVQVRPGRGGVTGEAGGCEQGPDGKRSQAPAPGAFFVSAGVTPSSYHTVTLSILCVKAFP